MYVHKIQEIVASQPPLWEAFSTFQGGGEPVAFLNLRSNGESSQAYARFEALTHIAGTMGRYVLSGVLYELGSTHEASFSGLISLGDNGDESGILIR